jgi:heme exporter protein CcmD
MNHAAYIVPAYVLTIGATLLLLVQSYVAMRRAEGRAEELRRERRNPA